jgi:predicted Zn-dependent protease with MMP-like domain
VSRRTRPYLVEFHRRRFERLVGVAMRQLPSEFASYLDNVAILIADEPTAEQLGSTESGDDEMLFGLYEGVPLTERSAVYSLVLPDRITLFRHTFEQECASEADMIDEIRRTILHEVGHHAGFGEDRLKDV